MLAWLAPAAASAVDITGTSAGLSWVAASGPVTGYAVQVSRNGASYTEEQRVAATSARVSGQVGDTLRVRVAAVDDTGRIGTPSTASDPIVFVQAAPPPPPPESPPPAPEPPPPPPPGDSGGDVDGDGVTDALAYHAKSGELSVLLQRADGTREWQSIGKPSSPGMKPVGYADVDGDGQADVLWRNSSSGRNELWRMNGSSHAVLDLPDAPARFRVRAFRDFSGDGLGDALFHDARSGESELWTLNGAGRTATLAVDAAPAGTVLAAVADVDGDAAPDLLWHDARTGELEGWLMDGATPTAAFTLPAGRAGDVPLGAGDLDGDGDDDLIWRSRHAGARTLDVWFVNGVSTPRKGIAARISKKTRVRGIVDATSDGRGEIVLVSKSGFRALTVDATGSANATGDMEWNTATTELGEVPTSKAWTFLVLE